MAPLHSKPSPWLTPVRYKHLGMFLRTALALVISFGIVKITEDQIVNVFLAVEALGLVIFTTNQKGEP